MSMDAGSDAPTPGQVACGPMTCFETANRYCRIVNSMPDATTSQNAQYSCSMLPQLCLDPGPLNCECIRRLTPCSDVGMTEASCEEINGNVRYTCAP
jgi:hypothetical protein